MCAGGFGGAKKHGQTADQETRVQAHKTAQAIKKQHGSLIGGMGVLKGRPNPVPCLEETTEGAYQAVSSLPFLKHCNASMTVDTEN
eukprot:1160488-Pelagomonas_calceolata.AAC.10